jgi:hypothetical protein
MWAVINTSNKNLKFYCFKTKAFLNFINLELNINEYGYADGTIGNHNLVVHELRCAGILVFVNKTEAREFAVARSLTGFKYLKLNPTILY